MMPAVPSRDRREGPSVVPSGLPGAPPSRAYHGPLVMLTVADAARVLPLLEGRPDVADVAAKLAAAVHADARWRLPIR